MGLVFVFTSSFLYLGLELFLLNQVALFASRTKTELLTAYVLFLVFNGLGALFKLPKKNKLIRAQLGVCVALLAIWVCVGPAIFYGAKYWLEFSLLNWMMFGSVILTAMLLGYEFVLTLKIGREIFQIPYSKLIAIDFFAMFLSGIFLFVAATTVHLLLQVGIFTIVSLGYTLFVTFIFYQQKRLAIHA